MIALEHAADPLSLPDAQSVSAEPLARLAELLRILLDRRTVLYTEWWQSYQAYNQIRWELVLYYHRDEHLGITAAEYKAGTVPAVIDASSNSFSKKIQLAQLDAVIEQVRCRCTLESAYSPD